MFNQLFRSLAGQSAAPLFHRQLVEALQNSALFRSFVHRTNHHISNIKTGSAEPFRPYVDPHAEPGFLQRFSHELRDGIQRVFGGKR